MAASVSASVVIPKYRISPQAAPSGFEGPEKLVTIPVFEEGENASVRVSTHVYNTTAEIDRLIAALEAA